MEFSDSLLLLQMATLALGAGTVAWAVSTWRALRRRRRLETRLAAMIPTGAVDGPDITGLGRISPAARVKLLLSRFYARKRTVYLPPGLRLWRASLIGVIVATAVGLALRPLAGQTQAAAGVALALVMAPRLAFVHSRRRMIERLLDQLAEAIGLVVRATRAGIPVSESLKMVGHELPEPIAPLFRRIVDETALGVELETVLARASESVGLAEFRFFVVTLILQRETGGNLTETLENLAEMIRQRRKVRLRARALTAEARGSSAVLAALPILAGGAIWALNPDYLGRLFTTAGGHFMLGLAVTLLALGMGTMQLLIRKTLA